MSNLTLLQVHAGHRESILAKYDCSDIGRAKNDAKTHNLAGTPVTLRDGNGRRINPYS